jgi:hypothetical protein
LATDGTDAARTLQSGSTDSESAAGLAAEVPMRTVPVKKTIVCPLCRAELSVPFTVKIPEADGGSEGRLIAD